VKPALPPGSIVKFRQQPVWVRYRWQLTSILVALLVQSAMITWLLFERRGRRTAELEARRRSLARAERQGQGPAPNP
jgi:hypothetical protein